MNDEDKVKQIIKNNLYMTIAVSNTDSIPWIANIYFVCDKDYNFYWYSPLNSKHSQIIGKNASVAISIFDSTAVGDDVDAVYIEAKAHEVKDLKELSKGLLLYGKKMLETKFVTGKKAYIEFVNSLKDFEGNSPIRMYKAVPEKIYKLAPSEIYKDKFVDSRIEIDFKKKTNE